METEIEEEKFTGLIEVAKTTVLAKFSGEDGLDSVVEETRLLIESFEHDMSTGASRKRTGSLANKVAKLKTSLDGMGKDLVAGWKTQAKAVDINRKKMRDELDELKVIARKPLTEWEAEQAVIEAAQIAQVAADNATRLEVQRQKDADALVEAERVKREKNRANIGKVHRKVKEQLMQFANIDEETAKRVVLAVKNIDDLNITY